jgi:hypothetical protein
MNWEEKFVTASAKTDGEYLLRVSALRKSNQRANKKEKRHSFIRMKDEIGSKIRAPKNFITEIKSKNSLSRFVTQFC